MNSERGESPGAREGPRAKGRACCRAAGRRAGRARFRARCRSGPGSRGGRTHPGCRGGAPPRRLRGSRIPRRRKDPRPIPGPLAELGQSGQFTKQIGNRLLAPTLRASAGGSFALATPRARRSRARRMPEERCSAPPTRRRVGGASGGQPRREAGFEPDGGSCFEEAQGKSHLANFQRAFQRCVLNPRNILQAPRKCVHTSWSPDCRAQPHGLF